MDQSVFEDIKHINEYGKEYRQAREFSAVLGYMDFDEFSEVVDKAKKACKHSGQERDNHFGDFTEMVPTTAHDEISLPSWKLSRYACYLIIQNADPSKDIVALGQSYFALQVRKQELSQQSLEDQKRIHLRGEVAQHNKKLFSAARGAGVSDYGEFYDYGYLGLYGMRKKDVIQKKGLKEKDNILDHMDSEELAANLFRATQAEAKIKREGIKGQKMASKAHQDVGEKIRITIKELGGMMPEEIPAVENIKHAKKRLKELEIISTPTTSRPPLLNVFELPGDINSIQAIITLIREYPGDTSVKIGESHYSVSVEGLEKIIKFFEA